MNSQTIAATRPGEWEAEKLRGVIERMEAPPAARKGREGLWMELVPGCLCRRRAVSAAAAYGAWRQTMLAQGGEKRSLQDAETVSSGRFQAHPAEDQP